MVLVSPPFKSGSGVCFPRQRFESLAVLPRLTGRCRERRWLSTRIGSFHRIGRRWYFHRIGRRSHWRRVGARVREASRSVRAPGAGPEAGSCRKWSRVDEQLTHPAGEWSGNGSRATKRSATRRCFHPTVPTFSVETVPVAAVVKYTVRGRTPRFSRPRSGWHVVRRRRARSHGFLDLELICSEVGERRFALAPFCPKLVS